MKNLLLVLSFLFTAHMGISQCTPDASKTSPGYYTSAGSGVMPAADLNKAYDETITVVLMSSIDFNGTPISVDSAILLNITNIPSGLTYTTLSNLILGGGNGCVKIDGTPSNPADVGTRKITLDIDVYGLGGTRVNRKETLDFTINGPSNVRQVKEEEFSVNLAPNPFYPVTTIRMGKVASKRISLQVFNLVGKEVFHNNNIVLDSENSFEFDASQLPGGIYLYQVSDGQNIHVDRLIVESH